jgi:Fic family protein
MFDRNWEMISGEAAREIELLNQSNVANVIEAIVRYALFHDQSGGKPPCSGVPNERALLELHRAGTYLLLKRPGAWRTNQVVLRRGGKLRHRPPPADQAPALVAEFMEELGSIWTSTNPVHVAAYALWRVNWIHPFKNGNGRTARAFSYLCLCLQYRRMLPGTVTLVDLISKDRRAYYDALAHASDTFAEAGAADLAPMEAYVERLLRTQLESVGMAATLDGDNEMAAAG